MTFHTDTTIFDTSDDLFVHWRSEDAALAEQEAADASRARFFELVSAGDLEGAARHAEFVDDFEYAMYVYGCVCRRCRKHDPAGCVA